MRCTNRGCEAEATATVPGYPDPLPKCFDHEREYADRYGPADIIAIGGTASTIATSYQQGQH